MLLPITHIRGNAHFIIPISSYQIATKILTWHNSTSVMSYAKFCGYHLIRMLMRAKQNYTRIWETIGNFISDMGLWFRNCLMSIRQVVYTASNVIALTGCPSLGFVSLMLLRAHYKNIMKLFLCNLNSDDPTSSQFCTGHDSQAVMTCAKLWTGWIVRLSSKSKMYLYEIWIMSS